ncbi:polymorphic toxin-type HINT domain-containing protein [Massilia sp. CCM 9210]|uniref:polymorphic toxin-type HINT domain-containing protein n=1 Tax=Massilia scottii TaxID=3057166 RepID=UPI00279644C7|nr:polymorphic toxin-type HINT domain-containing protein [Massilia sp. CCM 9210]MDQ1813289.1 polymorphic toxin-type HINT domain-containing protein [Massilia sp. CCM 9210]
MHTLSAMMRSGFASFLSALLMLCLLGFMSLAHAGNNAQYVWKSIPGSMEPGHDYLVMVKMKNTGTTTWYRDKFFLGSENYRDNTLLGVKRVSLSHAWVNPGDTEEFVFSIRRPVGGGVVNFQWRMVEEDVEWFGDMSENFQYNFPVEVPPPTPGQPAMPVVTMTSPVVDGTYQGGQYSGTVTVSGTATGGLPIMRMEILNGSTVVAHTFNYSSITYPVLLESGKTHSIAIRAIDTSYRQHEVRTNVYVAKPGLPVGKLEAPAKYGQYYLNKTNPNVPVKGYATASGGLSIVRLELMNLTQVLATYNNPVLNRVDSNVYLPRGTYQLWLRATDSSGQMSVVSEHTLIGVDEAAPPTIDFTGPEEGATFYAAGGVAQVRVTGRVTATGSRTAQKIEILNGDTVVGSSNEMNINMTVSVPVGSASLRIRVTDALDMVTTSASRTIKVVAALAGDNAQFVSQGAPKVLRPGQPFNMGITMKNTGSTTWTLGSAGTGSGYVLSAQNPLRTRVWNSVGTSALPGPIATGQEVSFVPPIVAPSVPGKYNLQWQMTNAAGQPFGEPTPNIVVDVVADGGPTVEITATPTNARVAPNGSATVTLRANASGNGRNIVKLQIFRGTEAGYEFNPIREVNGPGEGLGTEMSMPVGVGTYRFKARATDDQGASTDSAPVMVNITSNPILGEVAGVRINAAGEPQLVGWACEGASAELLAYDVMLDGPTAAFGGTLLTSGTANVTTEPDNAAIMAKCQTPGVGHHFAVNLGPHTATYAGRQLYVTAKSVKSNVSITLPCKDNHCTMPGSLRIGLTTPLNNDKYNAPGPVFMRARISNAVGPYDEVSFGFNGEWIAGIPDSEPDTYYASKGDLTASATPVPVVVRVRKGKTTVYSMTNMITISQAAADVVMTMVNPLDGAVISNGEKVVMSAKATGTTVHIGSVKFFINGVAVSKATGANGVWTAAPMIVPNGKLQISAGAYDGGGILMAMSRVSAVTVSGSPVDLKPIPVDITPPHLGNPDAGTLPGSLTVGKSGNAEYVVPLAVPPGTGGMAPSLTLNYSSEGSNGMLGLGWSLGGLTTINRCPKTIAQDGVPGRISFDNADRLCINGQRLVRSDGANPGSDVAAIDAAYWAAGAQYRTELESFSRFTRLPNGGFLMEAKDGLKHYYGTSPDNAIAQPNGKAEQPLLWALARTEDRHSNYMTVEYNQDAVTGEYTPKQIRYGANSAAGQSANLAVRFAYEPRTDAQIQYIGGGRNDLRSRLTVVSTFTSTAADGSGGSLVRDHRLNYTHSVNSGRSMLESMEACAINPNTGARECLPKTTFEWGQGPAPSFRQLPSITNPTFWPKSFYPRNYEADLDGSGRASFISANTYEYCLGGCASSGPKQFDDVDFTNAHAVMDGSIRILLPDGRVIDKKLPFSFPTTQLLFGDINGDGRDDLIAYSTLNVVGEGPQSYCLTVPAADGTVDFKCKDWRASVWPISSGALPSLVTFSNDRKKHIMFGVGGDCFYDEAVDDVKCVQRKIEHRTALAPYYSNLTEKGFFQPSSVSVGREDVSDFYAVWNNKEDKITYQGVTVCWNRKTVICETVFQEYQPNKTTYLRELNASKSTGDLNGDGLEDFAYAGGSAGPTVCLSKETGIDCQRTARIGDIGDFLGDGMTYTLSGDALCRYNSGQFICHTVGNKPASYGDTQINVNGDGVVDLIDRYATGGIRTVWTLAGPAWQDKIMVVTNGLGRRDEVEYSRADDAEVYRGFDPFPTSATSGDLYASYDPEPVYPMMPRRPGVMVKQLRANNGQGGWLRTNYRYKGAVVDAFGRGSSGFSTVWSTDLQTGIVTATNYNQVFPFTGSVARVSVTTPTFVALSDSENFNDKQIVAHPNGTQTSFVYTRKTVTKKRDLDGSDLGVATVTNEYKDGWGNLTQKDTVLVGAGETFSTSVSNQYTNDSSAWLLSKKTLEYETRKRADGVALTRTVAYAYHPVTGALSTKTVEPDAPVYRVATTYDRSANSFGLVNKQIETWQQPDCVPPAACSNSRTVSTTGYDTRGRFPETLKNALGHQENYLFYPGTGVRKRLVDSNNLITTWTADGFGRGTEERLPDGTTTRVYVKACNGGCPAGATVAGITDTFNGVNRIRSPLVTYTNSLGQTVQNMTWGLDGNSVRAIVVNTRYDQRGRAVEVDHPRFDSNVAYLSSRHGYDDLDRNTSVVTMDEAGTQQGTTFIYNGTVTTVINPKQQRRVETKNIVWQTVAVKDAKNKTTRFGYEPFGNLARTDDPSGNVIQVSYDLLGRKIGLVDPDLGTMTYWVDPVGRMYRQQNPMQKQRGQQTTLVHDMLDRMTQRLEPDLSSYWIFDTAARGLGKLAEAYTMTGTAKDYRRVQTYDHLGRPYMTTQTLTNTDYTVVNEHDEWGRRSSEAYTRGSGPSKRFMTYYGKTGEVDRVQREAVVLMKIAAQDASRRVTEVVFGNGLTQKKNYNRYTGRLEDGSLQTSAGAARLTEGYQYDVIGSVTNRTHYWDNVGFQESFKYDELNRLSTSQVAGQPEQTFTYDDAGNLKTKSNVGAGSTYVYPAPGASAVRPHAVQSISGIGTFGYDANGNLLSGAGRTISWNSFDMPIQIDKGGIKANFVYGPEHQRTRQNRSDGTSVVYAGAQEVESKANGELTVKTYWPQGIGVEIDIGSALTAFHWTHDDHLGSPIGISDQSGNLEEKLAYDAWGKRRSLTGGTVGQTITGCGALPAGNVTPDCIDGKVDNRGFTGHEMLDQLDLVHMNGRVYDPLVARFLSGDVLIEDPMNGQSYNRYSYVLNNPTNRTDPTGFESAPVHRDGVGRESGSICGGSSGNCSTYIVSESSNGTAARKTENNQNPQNGGNATTKSSETTESGDNAGKKNEPSTEKSTLSKVRDYFAKLWQAQVSATKNEKFSDFIVEKVLPAIPAEAGAVNVISGAGRYISALGKASDACGCCFRAGTPVLTENGSTPIEQIKIGQLVLARDAQTGETQLKPVTDLIVTDEKSLYELTTRSTNGEVARLQVTDNHPFWVDGAGWVDAEKLSQGTVLVDADKKPLKVVSLKPLGKIETTYNFTVADFHTYFAGPQKAFVHNTCACATAAAALAKEVTGPGLAASTAWKGFSKGSLAPHFEKHGAEFGRITQNEYFRQAKAFSAETGRFLEEKVGNFIVKYDPATTRTFVGHAGSREIRTFYKADARSPNPFQDAIALARKLSGQ